MGILMNDRWQMTGVAKEALLTAGFKVNPIMREDGKLWFRFDRVGFQQERKRIVFKFYWEDKLIGTFETKRVSGMTEISVSLDGRIPFSVT